MTIEHKPECNCKRCHAHHKDMGWLKENYGHPDFPCCTEEVDNRIAEKTWCRDKPAEHGDAYIAVEGKCLECVHEV